MAVLGGRGWLGRDIVGVARSRGVDVTVVSRPPGRGDGHGDRDRDGGGAPVVAVDLTDARALAEALRVNEIDVVINAAGCRLGPPAVVHAANAALPDRLGGLAAEAGWRLVHIGSAAEYGRAAGGPVPIAEDRRCEPVTTYARSKLAGTEAVAAWRARGAEALVARVFNVVGPDLPPDNPIHGLVRQARELVPLGEGDIAVGDPTTIRDIAPRRWIAEAVVALALADPVGRAGAAGPVGPPVVNVCSGRPTSFGDITWALARALDLEVRVRDLGWPRGGEIVGDPTRLRSLVAVPDPPSIDDLARSALGLDAGPAAAPGPTRRDAPARCANGESR
jgi:nucleoside-diphosphate-sugar epimerase